MKRKFLSDRTGGGGRHTAWGERYWCGRGNAQGKSQITTQTSRKGGVGKVKGGDTDKQEAPKKIDYTY